MTMWTLLRHFSNSTRFVGSHRIVLSSPSTTTTSIAVRALRFAYFLLSSCPSMLKTMGFLLRLKDAVGENAGANGGLDLLVEWFSML